MKRICRTAAAGLIATGCTAIGAVVGALSPSTGLLLAGRVIEGIGKGLIAVAAPVVVGMCFPAERRGIPMSNRATWMPVGRTLIHNVAACAPVRRPNTAVLMLGSAFGVGFVPRVAGCRPLTHG
jgi:MFS family permease